MSDLEHRAWVVTQRENVTSVLVPVPFLDAHAGKSGHGTGPTAPEELDRILMAAWNGAANTPRAHAVTLACPVALLTALAQYAEECMTQWVTRADLGHGVDMHIACAAALAVHVRHTICRELG